MTDLAAPGLTSARTKWQTTLIMVAILGLYVTASRATDSSLPELIRGWDGFRRIATDLFPPDWSYVPRIWDRLAETIHMAILATTLAAIVSVPIFLLSAANLFPSPWVHQPVRLFMNVLRTIPDILLAVIFVSIFGVGVFPGIMALFVFSLGILAKLMYETLEAIDMNPIEAIRASGGNRLQVIAWGVLPQILPQFVSFTLYVFEVNVRASVVLGFVGAGGVGLLLQQQVAFFNYPRVMTIILIIFATVLIIDGISNRIRSQLV